MKMECQNRERNGLDSKHIIRQATIEPTQDRYDDERSERHGGYERPDDLKLSGEANLDTG